MGAEIELAAARARRFFTAWGAHPRLRIVRVNTGVRLVRQRQPARKTDPDAYPVHFNPKGTSDIVGLIAPTGRMLMIECKAGLAARSRREQKIMQRVVTKFGGLYVLAWSLTDV
jgi:hypothetical protein